MASRFDKFVQPDAVQPDADPASRFDQFVQPGAIQPSAAPGISTGADVLFSAATGAGEGAHAIPGQLGDTYGFFEGIGNTVGDWLGLDPLTPEQKETFERGPAGFPDISPPSTADLEKFTGYDTIKHVPQTPEGKFAKTAVSTGIQSITGGPRAVAGGMVAGAGSEAAGQATEGTWAEPIARIIGGLGAGATANTITNAYQRGRPRLPEAPTQAMLESTADFGFEFARQLGAEYDGDYLLQPIHQLYADLRAGGGSPITTPKTYGLIEELFQRARGGTLTISDLHAERKAFGKAAKDFTNKEEQAVAMQAIAMIDNFIRHPDPRSVLRGDATTTADIWGDAMGDYAGAMRSQRLQNAEEIALRQARGTHSGLNIENKLRQKATWMTDPNYPARRAGLSDAEVAMLNDLADGTPGRNTLRYVSKLFGGGGGLGQAVTAGLGGVLSGGSNLTAAASGLGVLGIGRGLTGLANRFARRDFEAVDASTRRRTPLATNMPLAPPPVTQMTIPEILAATTGPMREDQETPRLDRAGVAAVTNALVPR